VVGSASAICVNVFRSAVAGFRNDVAGVASGLPHGVGVRQIIEVDCRFEVSAVRKPETLPTRKSILFSVSSRELPSGSG
jgi:hypothetical protein